MPLRKGAWSPEEDQKLIAYINRYRIWNWSQMARPAGLERSGKSCRLRWVNYLRPGIKRGKFSKEEEDTVFKWHEVLGNRWSAIAAKLPGRTDNEIKNYWHTHLKKRYRNISHSTTVLHSVEPPGVEANMNESPGIQDLSPPDAPKMSNLPDSWSWGVGMSPQLSDLDDLSSSSNDDPVEIDRNETILEETFSPSETLELQSLREQPFSLDDMCLVETDIGIIYVSSY